MLILNNLIGFGSGSGSGAHYDVNPIDLDSGWLTKTTALTADADGKTGTVSFWFNNRNGDTSADCLYDTSRFTIYIDSGIILLNGATSGGTTTLNMNTAKSYPAGSGWHHYMASWDLATGTGHVYVDGVSDRSSSSLTLNNNNINYNVGNIFISANPIGGAQWPGDIAELYISRNYIDLSVQANRDKFITQYGYPVYLGATGTLPNGSQPIIYLKGLASAWETNSGYGGNFTRNGTIATAATTPSELRAIVSYRNIVSNTTNASTLTFPSSDIGREAPNRNIILAIVANPNVSGSFRITSVDIGGTTATALYAPDLSFTDGTTWSYAAEFWGAAIPSGTTATITVTCGGQMTGIGIAVYAGYNMNSITPIDTDAQGLNNTGGQGETVASWDLDTQANGFAICTMMTTGGTTTFTGVIELYENVNMDARQACGGMNVATTGATLTITSDPFGTHQTYPAVVGSWR